MKRLVNASIVRTTPLKEWCGSITPIAMAHGFKKGGKICFNVHEGIIGFTLDKNERRELMRVLKESNGVTTLDDLQKNSLLSEREFRKMMEALFKYQILHPSNKLGTWFHRRTKEDSKYLSIFDEKKFVKLHGLHRKSENLKQKTPLNILLYQRHSTRDFIATQISQKEIKEMLDAMYFTDGTPTVASGGGIYPLEFYTIAINTDLSRGVYKYHHEQGSFEKVRGSLDERTLYFALQEDVMARTVSYVIVVCSDLNTHAEKYANRGYRYSIMEAGAVTQNAYLKATELNRGVLAFGGFSDSRLQAYLNAETDPLIAIYVGEVGEKTIITPPINTVHRLINEYVKKREVIKKYSVGRFPYKKVEIEGFYASSEYESKATGHKRKGFGFGVAYNRNKALLSSLAESVERYYSGAVVHDFISSFADLSNAIHPTVFSGLKVPFVDAGHYKWVQASRLRTNEQVVVLADQVFYPLSAKQLGYERIAKASSNGVAAHTTKEKAIEHGLLELIERDAVAMAWYGNNPILQLKKLPPEFVSAQSFWEKHAYDVRFFDITTDSVPVILCAFSSEKKFPYFIVGACAHYSLDIALRKAFSEAEYAMVAWDALGDEKIKEKDIIRPLDHGMFYAQKNNSKIPFRHLNLSATPRTHTEWTCDQLIDKFDPIVFTHHEGELYVERVMSEKLCPILFGYGLSVEGHRRFKDLNLTQAHNVTHFFP